MSTPPVAPRALGAQGPAVGPVGLGCMPMSSVYGPADEAGAHAALEAALAAGSTLWDTANVYGAGGNERLIAPVLAQHRDEVVIATKFGFTPEGTISGHPDDARRCIDESLARLGVDSVDLWYLHRVDPQVPIEETVGAMAAQVEAGKVRHLGLSEASADSLRRASSVHPIAALQSEWSLWTRDIEAEVLGAARACGTAIVAYCPLGRGMLAGALNHVDELGADDYRRTGPRFADEAFEANRRAIAGFLDFARERACTPGQLAIAWLLAQGDDVIPIPGTRKAEHARENAAAAGLVLTHEDCALLESLVPTPVGARYAREHAYGDSPPAS